MSEEPTITLMICDDHRLLTDALAAIVHTDPRLTLVGEPVDNAEAAIALADRHKPDVALMDIEINGPVDGIQATRRITDVSPGTNVVVITGHRRPTVLVEAIEAGAVGFLDKSSAVDEVLRVVHAAAAGEILVEPRVLAKLMPVLAAERQATQHDRQRVARLTRRERQVLELMAQGHRNEVIADRLFISLATVRTHAQNILSKLGVHSQLEAVALAARSGVVGEPTTAVKPGGEG